LYQSKKIRIIRLTLEQTKYYEIITKNISIKTKLLLYLLCLLQDGRMENNATNIFLKNGPTNYVGVSMFLKSNIYTGI